MVDFATGFGICFSNTAMEMLKPLILEPNHPWSFMHLAKTYPDDIALGHIFQSKRFRVEELAENLLVHSSDNKICLMF